MEVTSNERYKRKLSFSPEILAMPVEEKFGTDQPRLHSFNHAGANHSPRSRITRILLRNHASETSSLEGLIDALRVGLEADVVDRVRSHFGLRTSEVLRCLGLTPSMYARKKSHGARLGLPQSDRAYRLVKVGIEAEVVFVDEEVAHDWLRSYIPALGTRPIDLLDTQPGVEQVEAVLGRIEHGVYS